MTWIRLDDSFDGHPKTLHAWGLAPASVGLWPQALAWAGNHLTDGHVTTDFVVARTTNRRQRDQLTSALVEARLWVPDGRGWQIHDFTDFNPTRAQVQAASAAKAEAGRLGAARRWQLDSSSHRSSHA